MWYAGATHGHVPLAIAASVRKVSGTFVFSERSLQVVIFCPSGIYSYVRIYGLGALRRSSELYRACWLVMRDCR